MEKQDMDADTKLDILKHIQKDQRGEMEYRREREYRIFTWSSNILLALIAALLITKQTETLVWKHYGVVGNAVASAAVIVIVIYSTTWQIRNTDFRGQNALVISRISKILHCFDQGYYDSESTSLYPSSWANYGWSKVTLRSRLFAVNYVSATFWLGALALIMIWIP